MVTHNDLVKLGLRWIKRHTWISFGEFVTGAHEVPDVIGWQGGNSILIECKASRSDFLSDKRKWVRRVPWLAMGRRRYFLCTKGLITIDDLPEKWGLLWVKGNRVYIEKQAEIFEQINLSDEIVFLTSMLRRVQIRIEPDKLADWLRYENMR